MVESLVVVVVADEKSARNCVRNHFSSSIKIIAHSFSRTNAFKIFPTNLRQIFVFVV